MQSYLLQLENHQKIQVTSLSKLCESNKFNRLETSSFVENVNSGDIDSLFKFNDEVSRTEASAENFIRRLIKNMQEYQIKSGFDQDKAWRYFRWKDSEQPLRLSLNQLEESIRNHMSRNEEEYKAQQEDFMKKQNYLNEVRKVHENPLNKDILDIIIPDRKYDTGEEREYTCFIYILTLKKDQVLWLKDNYKTLVGEEDLVCPGSLSQCNVKHEQLASNKEFRCLRMMVMKASQKIISDKLKGKGQVVKNLKENNKVGVNHTVENMQELEAELADVKHGFQNQIKDLQVGSQDIQMHLKFLKVQVESKLQGGYDEQDYQYLKLPTKNQEKFKKSIQGDFEDDNNLMEVFMPEV